METKINGNGHLPFLNMVETLEDYLSSLLVGKSLLLLPNQGWALELSEIPRTPRLHADLVPSRLPFPDEGFETVGVHIPDGYPKESTEDLLAEVARIASQRIVCAGRVVPVDIQNYFQTNRAFRLVFPHVLQLTDMILGAMILSVFEVAS